MPSLDAGAPDLPKLNTSIIIPDGYPFEGAHLEEVISPKEIQDRISQIGRDISKKYKGKIPIIIGVLNGAFLFMADLVRHLDIEFEVDFLSGAFFISRVFKPL